MVEGRENIPAASAAYLNIALEPTAPVAVCGSRASPVARRLTAGVRRQWRGGKIQKKPFTTSEYSVTHAQHAQDRKEVMAYGLVA